MKKVNKFTLLGENVKSLREGLKLTRRKLADRAGVKYQTITKIENGEIESPRGSVIYDIAKALKSTPDFLMYGRGFSTVSELPSNKIPVLDWKEINGWCEEGPNKNMSSDFHDFVPSPLEEFNKSIFAIKMINDVLECSNSEMSAPSGSVLFCEPHKQIVKSSLMVFYNYNLDISFIREAVIDDKTYLRPLNTNKYPMIEFNPLIHKPIAKILCVLKFINT